MMTARPQHDINGFVLGFVIGGIVGAGVAILCAPRQAAGLRRWVADAAADIGGAATGRTGNVSARASDMMDGFKTSAAAVRDDVADAVARGARELEQFATASKRRTRS